MRRITAVACVTVAGLIAGGCTETLLATREVVDINLTITCTDKGVDVSVSPFVAVIDTAVEVRWNLPDNPQVEKVTIKKKHWNDRWPFADALPIEVGKGNPKGAGKMKEGAKKKYHYDIAGTCKVSETQSLDFVIDPDIIIIPK